MYTLHRLPYSPYVRKVELVLELLGVPFTRVEVRYGDREDLARLTGGYVYVPVLQTPAGEVIVESRTICARLLAAHARPGVDLVPRGLEAAVWALHDHAEGAIEDTLFRLAAPAVQDAWPTAWERALYTLIKERKYGPGCVDAWRRDRAALLARAHELLAPTAATFAARPFVLGDAPTLADAALYGQWMMLDREPGLLAAVGAPFVAHARRLEAFRDALPR